MALGGKVVQRKYPEQGTMFSYSVQLPWWIRTCMFSHVVDPMCALVCFNQVDLMSTLVLFRILF
jgi:hypothetical protein